MTTEKYYTGDHCLTPIKLTVFGTSTDLFVKYHIIFHRFISIICSLQQSQQQ